MTCKMRRPRHPSTCLSSPPPGPSLGPARMLTAHSCITIVGVSFLSSESPFCPRTYARRGDEGPGRSTTATRITTRLVSRVSMYAYVCTITKSASLCFCRSRPFWERFLAFFGSDSSLLLPSSSIGGEIIGSLFSVCVSVRLTHPSTHPRQPPQDEKAWITCLILPYLAQLSAHSPIIHWETHLPEIQPPTTE